MARSLLLASVAAALAAGPASSQIFDVSPTGPLNQIHQAVAIAPPGSTIRVAPGSYAPFTLTVGLTIMARPGGPVLVVGQSAIANLPQRQLAAIAGLTFRSREWLATQLDSHALVVGPCAGSVLLRACAVETGTVTWRGSGVPAPIAAMLVTNCQMILDEVTCQGRYGSHGLLMSFSGPSAPPVAISGGSYQGGESSCGLFCFPDSQPAGHAVLIAQAGVVYIADATLRGGDVTNLTPTSAGGIGLALSSSRVLLRRCTVQGGLSGIHAGNVGGAGLFTSPGCAVDVDQTTFQGGASGGGSGAAGVPVAGPAVPAPHLLSSLNLSPPIFGIGQSANIQIRSHPFEPHITLLFLGLLGIPLPLPGFNEPLFMDPLGFYMVFASGFTDPTGTANLPLPIPNDPALIGLTLLFQDVGVTSATLGLFLSCPSGTVIR